MCGFQVLLLHLLLVHMVQVEQDLVEVSGWLLLASDCVQRPDHTDVSSDCLQAVLERNLVQLELAQQVVAVAASEAEGSDAAATALAPAESVNVQAAAAFAAAMACKTLAAVVVAVPPAAVL